jgi:hypothetical protein
MLFVVISMLGCHFGPLLVLLLMLRDHHGEIAVASLHAFENQVSFLQPTRPLPRPPQNSQDTSLRLRLKLYIPSCVGCER